MGLPVAGNPPLRIRYVDLLAALGSHVDLHDGSLESADLRQFRDSGEVHPGRVLPLPIEVLLLQDGQILGRSELGFLQVPCRPYRRYPARSRVAVEIASTREDQPRSIDAIWSMASIRRATRARCRRRSRASHLTSMAASSAHGSPRRPR